MVLTLFSKKIALFPQNTKVSTRILQNNQLTRLCGTFATAERLQPGMAFP